MNAEKARACGVLAAGALGVALLTGSMGAGKGALACGMAAVFFGALALSFRLQARLADRSREAVLAGEPLAQWSYRSDEWRGYTAAEGERAKGKARMLPAWFGAMALAGGLMFGAAPLLLAALTAAGALAGFAAGRMLAARGDASTVVPPQARVTRDAAMLNGHVIGWNGSDERLESLALLDGTPRVLEFTVRRQLSSRRARMQLRVPVPAGREAEAGAVMEALGFGGKGS